MSHLGRPDGRKQEKFTLAPVATELQSVLGRNVQFINDCASDEAIQATANPGNAFISNSHLEISFVAWSIYKLFHFHKTYGNVK